MGIKNKIANNLKNIIGKSVKHNYLIIESDDWGSIRVPSKQAFENLTLKGIKLNTGDAGRYNLENVLKKWPDVRFITSGELGDILKN